MVRLPRPLAVALAVIGAVPVGTGLLGVVGGLSIGPGPDETSRYFDSEYRFLNAVWLVVGLVLWWSLRQPARRAVVTRVVLGAAVLGGVSRLISAFAVGWPPLEFRLALVVELVVIPLLLAWHVWVLGPRAPQSPSESA